MSSKLYDAYREASSVTSNTDEPLPAVVIPGRTHDYVSLGPNNQPLLLLSCVDSASLRRPPIRLQNLTVEFGVQYRVRTSSSIVEDNFVVISLHGEDLTLAEPFCLASDALLAALPEVPSAVNIEGVVRQFVELLSAMSLPSARAVAGLWAELWLMYVAADRRAAIAAWHLDTTDRFDFSFPSHFVEVKATEREQRNHDFSYEQLRRSTLPIRIVSLRLRHAQGGKSVSDLVESLQTDLNPDLRTKLVRNVFGAIGSAVSEAFEIRFDEKFAAENLRTIAGDKVPAVTIPATGPISAVRFRVNLSDSSLSSDLRQPLASAALKLL